MSTGRTVAVLGLGAMGSRIARRFLHAGHNVVVWNRSSKATMQLADAGAMTARTPASAAQRADVVITMVTDPAALQAITEGKSGLAAGLGNRTAVVEMSTVGPRSIERLASALPNAGRLLDAPVLGSVQEAESGTLVLFVGGPESLVEELRPLLSSLGSIVHVGPVGSGAAAKLVANSALLGSLGVLGEALAFAAGLGLSVESTERVLASTPLAAQATRRRAAIESDDYPPRFSLSLAYKDAQLITALAAELNVDLRLAAAIETWLREAQSAGWGELDYSAVLARIVAPNRTDVPRRYGDAGSPA